MKQSIINQIENGQAVLGIELGSTRIKAVLIGTDHQPIAVGGHQWENKLENGVWTYDLEDALAGVSKAYAQLNAQVKNQYGIAINKLAGIGISAMMHGYLVFDKDGQMLTPFRTWRNTMTAQSSQELSELFHFAIPQRWSIAHLYQAILNGEQHVKDIAFLTTLAGFIHWKLTGRRELGVGDASGVFPLDEHGRYDKQRMQAFEQLISGKSYGWRLEGILPGILFAGEEEGRLTHEGAKLLDDSGQLEAGIPLCPPEGDAGTGMVATNAVAPRTGNVSAGTSIFAMLVLEKPLLKLHPEIDIVATPAGSPVAMVHCNNCTTQVNDWIGLLADFMNHMGIPPEREKLYDTFFGAALQGEMDAGGLVSCGYYSGEHITGFESGRPFLAQAEDSKLNFANLARGILFSSLATLKIGMKALEEEQVGIDRILGHGGLYKSGTAGQRFTAAALNTPVSVMGTASEGGAWGIALLASYMASKQPGQSLGDYLDSRVFSTMAVSTLQPEPQDVAGFASYLERFKAALHLERAAVTHL